jgi:hypothetical protein
MKELHNTNGNKLRKMTEFVSPRENSVLVVSNNLFLSL